MEQNRFLDRRDAGRALAGHLREYSGRDDVLVLALPRGGVPVAYEVAREIGVPMDVFLVRKLGVPGREEFAMGAIATGGVRIINEEVVRGLGITEDHIAAVAADEKGELERRDREYRGGRASPVLEGRIVILVDDGLATGSTMRAAAMVVQAQEPARVIVAAPVAAPDTCEAFREEVDEVVCVLTPDPFHAVGLWYEDFSQTSDEEVHDLLARAEDQPAHHTAGRRE